MGRLHLASLQKEHQQKLEEQARMSGNNGTLERLKGFLKPTGYKPIILLIGLFFFQQFAGIYITLFYAVTFFKVRFSKDCIANKYSYHYLLAVGIKNIWNMELVHFFLSLQPTVFGFHVYLKPSGILETSSIVECTALHLRTEDEVMFPNIK